MQSARSLVVPCPFRLLKFVFLTLTVLGIVQQAQAAARPNIVVVLVDDLRWDELGCMGHPFVRTPAIDRVANEGARFRNAFCTTPLCSPVRACLLTGLYTHHHGIRDNINRSEASHKLKTFPRVLQSAGYETAYVGKWHMGNDDTARPGFDHWVSMKGQGTSFDPLLNVNGKQVKHTGHTTDALNEHALEFVSQERDKPFCLYVAHKALHPELTQRDDGSITDPKAAQFLPAKRHEKLYAEDAIPRRLNVVDSLKGKPALQRKIKGQPPLSRATGTSDETVRDRLRMLAAVDDGVGQLIAQLEKSKQLDNTVFVVTSDHGYWYGEHGLSVERRLPYEEAIRVPLLVRFPREIKPGTTIDQFALSIDLAPTLIDLAGTLAAHEMDGRSLAPLLEGKTPNDWRKSFLIEYNTDTVFPRVFNMGYKALRTERWKYIRYNKLQGMNELYDLKNDPYEMNNLIDAPQSKRVLGPLKAELEKFVLADKQLQSARESADAGTRVICERNVPVKMRDGVILRADVHRPATGGPYPVLVLRTPYGKGGPGRFDRYVKAGYIVVSQDARGRYQSDGKWESFVRFNTNDAKDGYDTVEWAAKLPGSTGKVGTFGASYNAFLQWRLAPLRPPSLVAMAAFSIPARYLDLEGPGTIRPGRRLHWWVNSMSPDMRMRSNRPGFTARAEGIKLWEAGASKRWLNFLPWNKLPREVFEDEAEPVRAWLKAPHTDPWALQKDVKEIAVPNLDVIGWYDHCNGDMMLNRAIMNEAKTETARKGSRTVIGPWSHAGRGQRRYGNIDFGPNARFDAAKMEIRWFDYWLKGHKNGIDQTAPVRIFVMGDNHWRDEQHWPLKRAKERVFYLASAGKANTPGGDGRLLEKVPSTSANDQYVYDPSNPVLSLHGPALFTIPTDQRPLADRQDILVYQTEPLTERIEVTGNPVVELYAASSAEDTDFFVRLVDVDSQGLARDVSLGMVRARYRKGLKKPDLIKPGEVVKYTIRMNPTSNAFLPGHRLRLDITSSDFPNYDRNHNTPADQNADAELQKATQTVHHGKLQATRIVLPWVVNPQGK